jgi:SAM-dependent methyltransferase
MEGSTFYATVLPLVRDKDVLDIGSIGHSYAGRQGYKTWNFAILAGAASTVRGIDLLEADVAAARRDGFDIDVGDAESYLAPKPVDVVFAGELIEHLSNPGRFLECSHRNLRPDGQLVLTTPNTYSFAKLFRVATRRTNEPPVNPEHTCYFTPATLAHLASRHGFVLRRTLYCDLDYTLGHGSRLKRAELAINRKVSGALPRFSQTMVLVFDKAGAAAV